MSSMSISKKTILMGAVLILSLMQIESFAGQNWERITQLPTKRMAFSTAVVDDKIYIIGGSLVKNKNGPYGIPTVEAYDTQTNTWQKVADMPTPREAPKAAVVDGIIYVFGGFSQKKGAKTEYPVRVEAYNPATDRWTRKKDMPISRLYFGIGVVAGNVYLIGGNEGLNLVQQEQRMDRVDIYNPATDTWAKGPKMPTRRSYMRAEVVSDRIYVIGGSGWPVAGWGPFLPLIEEYDPISRQWRKQKDMVDFRFVFSTVVVEDDIYLIGGTDESRQYLATVDMYHPRTEAWHNIPELPMPTYTIDAATVKGKIYLLGGFKEGFQFVPDVLAFDTGFRAVEATGKMLTRWGELKAEPQRRPQRD